MGLTKRDMREWDRMNAENAKAAKESGTGKVVVTRGNTGRSQRTDGK